MIPLQKPTETVSVYNKWKSSVANELQSTFGAYCNDKSPKWIEQSNIEHLQSFLFPTSHNKCAYCECNPKFGNSDLQIDHFYPKKTEEFKHLAFDFDNLIPCCPLCNKVKHTNFKKNGVEMLNPYHEKNLSVHLKLDDSLTISGKSEQGNATISILGNSLNSKKYFDEIENIFYKGGLFLREKIKKAIDDKMLNLRREHEHFENYLSDSKNDLTNERVKKSIETLYSMLRNLILDIDEKEPFTATCAYLILNNIEFKRILLSMQNIDNQKYNELQKMIKKIEKYNIA